MPCRSDYDSIPDDGDEDDEEEGLSIADLMAMPKSKVLLLARECELAIPDKIARGPLKFIRQYVIENVFTDEAVSGSVEFKPSEDPEIADVTTREMLLSLAAQPDAGDYTQIMIGLFPYLTRMREEVSSIAPMLCAVCRVLEQNGIPIPETVNDWWIHHKIEDQKRVEARVRELRMQLVAAERAREELDSLIGEPKIVRHVRRIKLPRR